MRSKIKKEAWEVSREKVVASAAFIKLFEKARKAMHDPQRKACKHGHPICAANAHVGDLKRLKRYACDPCNRAVQVKYAKNSSNK
jgi:hypothetical protein